MDIKLEKLRNVRLKYTQPMYIVGGFIRDFFMGKESTKVDLFVKNDPEKIALAYAAEIGGWVKAYLREGKRLEGIENISVSAAYRYDFYRVFDQDNQIVANISQMKYPTIEECLKHRDFTINAMAIEVFNLDILTKITVIDPVQGLRDLEDGIVRQVYREAFLDNPLRMLKGIRYMAQLDFVMDQGTIGQIKENIDLLRNIPNEKYTYEIFEILKSKRAAYYLDFMERKFEMFQIVFPEIIPAKTVGECKYHVVDVFTHSIHTLEKMEEMLYTENYFEDHIEKAYRDHLKDEVGSKHGKYELLKIAALFHDIGKPACRYVDETGRTRFKGHEIAGAEIVTAIGQRLKLSNKEISYLSKVVEKHMIPLWVYQQNDVSGKNLYDIFQTLDEITLDVLIISLADITATRELLDPDENMLKFKVFFEYLADNYITRYLEVKNISHVINGRDILQRYEVKDTEKIGQMLDEIKKAIYFGTIGRDAEEGLRYLKGLGML